MEAPQDHDKEAVEEHLPHGVVDEGDFGKRRGPREVIDDEEHFRDDPCGDQDFKGRVGGDPCVPHHQPFGEIDQGEGEEEEEEGGEEAGKFAPKVEFHGFFRSERGHEFHPKI